MMPAGGFGEDFGLVGAGLFVQLAQRRLARGFAGVDAALRHLPRRQPGRHVNAPADEDIARRVQQHDPDRRPIGGEVAFRQAHRALRRDGWLSSPRGR